MSYFTTKCDFYDDVESISGGFKAWFELHNRNVEIEVDGKTYEAEAPDAASAVAAIKKMSGGTKAETPSVAADVGKSRQARNAAQCLRSHRFGIRDNADGE